MNLPSKDEILDAQIEARLEAQEEYEDQVAYEREALKSHPSWCWCDECKERE